MSFNDWLVVRYFLKKWNSYSIKINFWSHWKINFCRHKPQHYSKIQKVKFLTKNWSCNFFEKGKDFGRTLFEFEFLISIMRAKMKLNGMWKFLIISFWQLPTNSHLNQASCEHRIIYISLNLTLICTQLNQFWVSYLADIFTIKIFHS